MAAAAADENEAQPQPEPEPQADDATNREEDGDEGDGGPLVESQVPGGMETPTKRPHRVPPLDTRPMPVIDDDDKLADDLLIDAQTEGLRSRVTAEQSTTKAGDFLYVQRELLPPPRLHHAACPPLHLLRSLLPSLPAPAHALLVSTPPLTATPARRSCDEEGRLSQGEGRGIGPRGGCAGAQGRGSRGEQAVLRSRS